MQFLRTAFWVIVAVAIALFSKANWDIAPSYSGRVPVKLWADIILEVRLPVLIVTAFLLGLLPMWGFARVSRWRIRRKLESAEHALAVSAAPMTQPAADLATPPALPQTTDMPGQP
ncbi:MAG TPA: LapA family protein [Sphingobium sp.]|nr:LapA family protein [Sphingobium sp.]